MTPDKFIAMKKDAERYRRLRLGCHLEFMADEREVDRAEGAEGLDAAIDAAMGADDVQP